MPRHAKYQRCWNSLIGCTEQAKNAKNHLHAVLMHNRTSPVSIRAKVSHFSISIASFSHRIAFSQEMYNFQHSHTHTHKARNLVFILSHYSYALLAQQFQFVPMMYLHIISVYLAKIYFESASKALERRILEKLIQKLLMTQLDAMKKFVSAISSRRLVNFRVYRQLHSKRRLKRLK